MKEGLIWGTGKIFQNTFSAIKYHEANGHFKIKAVTSNEQVYTYDYIRVFKENINVGDYDFVIIMAEDEIFKNILSEALNIGFKKEQIIMSKVVRHPLFDVDKYLDILKYKPTIFANRCFGGHTYNSMGLEFSSPLVNIYFVDDDYIKFLKSPKFYLSQKLEVKDWVYNETLKMNYPVVSCADLSLHFYHNDNFEVAKVEWERRKNRINWDNIICMMQTIDPKIEEEFNNLEYEKKICFVPYKTDKKNSLYVDVTIDNKPFSQIINRIGDGSIIYYNPFDLLLTGIAKKLYNKFS